MVSDGGLPQAINKSHPTETNNQPKDRVAHPSLRDEWATRAVFRAQGASPVTGLVS